MPSWYSRTKLRNSGYFSSKCASAYAFTSASVISAGKPYSARVLAINDWFAICIRWSRCTCLSSWLRMLSIGWIPRLPCNLEICTPKRVWNGSLIAPSSKPKVISSNGCTIAPRPNQPKSPPRIAEPLSSECISANAAKSAPSAIANA